MSRIRIRKGVSNEEGVVNDADDDADDKVGRITEDRLSTADLAEAGREQQKVEPGRETESAAEAVTPLPDDREIREEHRTLNRRTTAATPSATGTPGQVGRLSDGTPAGMVGGMAAGTATAMAKDTESGPLFSSDEAANLRSQWDAIQVAFVDEPRRAVEQADVLVALAMKRLAEQFAEERSRLEGQWDRGGDVSTEDLRLALRRYRSFFGRLLSV
jgi:hypothetical protein